MRLDTPSYFSTLTFSEPHISQRMTWRIASESDVFVRSTVFVQRYVQAGHESFISM